MPRRIMVITPVFDIGYIGSSPFEVTFLNFINHNLMSKISPIKIKEAIEQLQQTIESTKKSLLNRGKNIN